MSMVMCVVILVLMAGRNFRRDESETRRHGLLRSGSTGPAAPGTAGSATGDAMNRVSTRSYYGK